MTTRRKTARKPSIDEQCEAKHLVNAEFVRAVKSIGKKHVSSHGDVKNGSLAGVFHNPKWGYDIYLFALKEDNTSGGNVHWGYDLVKEGVNSTDVLVALDSWERAITGRQAVHLQPEPRRRKK